MLNHFLDLALTYSNDEIWEFEMAKHINILKDYIVMHPACMSVPHNVLKYGFHMPTLTKTT